jgi:hypothetical protein
MLIADTFMWKYLFKVGSSIHPGDFLIISRDVFNGFLGDNITSLERMRGKVLKILSINKDSNKIELELPGGGTYDIPYKNWKEYAIKFKDIEM